MRTTGPTAPEATAYDRCDVCGLLQTAEQLDRRCAIFTEVPPHAAYPYRLEAYRRMREEHGLQEIFVPNDAPPRRLPGYTVAENAWYAAALATNPTQNASRGHSRPKMRKRLPDYAILDDAA